jgi:metal-dependent amidase/aminoacylase/carboxypeptidase family protein
LLDFYGKQMQMQGEAFESQEIDENETRGSTDMGNVSHHVPSIHPLFDIKCKQAYHTREFCEQSATEEALSQALKCTISMSNTALECITNQEFFAKVRNEFGIN